MNKTIEKTEPKIFHIHIDAKEIDQDIYKFALEDLKFVDSDFDGHLREFDYALPNKHLTLKVKEKEDYERSWKLIKEK